MPIKVSLEAFTPFVPLNADDSSYPAAVIRYSVKNTSRKQAAVSIAGSLANPTGGLYSEWGNLKTTNPVKTEFRQADGISGLWCTAPGAQSDFTTFGTMALVTDLPGVTAKPAWLNRGWWDGAHDFWDDFSEDGELGPASYGSIDFGDKPDKPEMTTIGALAAKQMIRPGETKVFQFILAWHFPNRVKRWETKPACECGNKTVRNHYATRFTDAWDAGLKLLTNLPRLERNSRDFSESLYSSTLPAEVIDALASNITVLRSNTCFRLEDWTFA
jgi:uncharacterized protein (DUF608 family)